MSASALSFFRDGPPPPKVALLPDALFFSRAVPVTPGATAAEAASQVELALEAISPFPLAQIYYGWFWIPGAEHAFVFATYRRRFTAEQSAEWSGADLVIPAYAATFGRKMDAATAVVISAPESLTAVYWENAPVPTKVLSRPLALETTEEERQKVREELLRDLGGTKAVLELAGPLVAQSATSDREIVFRAGDFESRLPAPVVGAMDVRDKGDLADLRSARRRDVTLWRVAMGCVAALFVLAFAEVGLLGGKAWLKTRTLTINARKSKVDKIATSQDLARQINELTTKRLLPLEMVTLLVGADAEHKRKPDEITFTRVQTSGLYTLFVDAQTNNASLLPVYEADLKKLPELESVRLVPQSSSGDRTLFQIVVSFKPEALKPSTAG